jgi:predicted Na+-dependent transporter
MTRILQGLLNVAVPLFAVASMASVGMAHSLRELFAPLRKHERVLAALVANFVLVPLVCWAVVSLVGVAKPHAAGLFLMACAAGAPFTVMFTRLAGGDVALGSTLVVLLLLTSLVYVPIVVPWVLPGTDFDVLQVVWTLTSTMLLPLALGLLLRARAPGWASRLRPGFGMAARVALAVLIAATLLVNLPAIVGLVGSGVILCAAGVVLGGLLSGYALGGPKQRSRTTLGFATGQRNVAAAMVVASTGFDSDEPLLAVVVSSLVGFAILFPATRLLRRWPRRAEGRGERVRFDAPDGQPDGRRRA